MFFSDEPICNSFKNIKVFLYVNCCKKINQIGITEDTNLSWFSFNINPLLHRYSFWCINNRQLLKTFWEKEKLLILNEQFLLFPHCFLLNQLENCIPICPYFWHHIFICCWIVDWLIEWCFTSLLTVFVISRQQLTLFMLSWVSPVLGWALKCLAQGHSHEKPQRIQCGSNQGPQDYESNTLPLIHVGPCCWIGRA